MSLITVIYISNIFVTFTEIVFKMERSITQNFIILAIHPEKGRIIIDNLHFSYTLSGAVLMDLMNTGEISFENNRLVSRVKRNGETLHDRIEELLTKASKPRRISYWIQKLTRERKLVFRESINMLITQGLIRHEKRYFLNIIPYNRYFISGNNLRNNIINELREILLHDKQPTMDQAILIGLLKASRSSNILAIERAEKGILRRKVKSFVINDIMSPEIEKVISQVQSAITASITAAAVAAT
jgi:hypothetical protein